MYLGTISKNLSKCCYSNRAILSQSGARPAISGIQDLDFAQWPGSNIGAWLPNLLTIVLKNTTQKSLKKPLVQDQHTKLTLFKWKCQNRKLVNKGKWHRNGLHHTIFEIAPLCAGKPIDTFAFWTIACQNTTAFVSISPCF